MCGVVGLIGSPDAAREAFLGLTTLQHRGQDAAGILTYDSEGLHTVKNLGLVENVFTAENIKRLTGDIAVGHARYSTSGRGDTADVQPLVLSYPYGMGMVHNGNIVNSQSLSRHLKKKLQRQLLTHSDTEVLLQLFADELSKHGSTDSNGDKEIGFVEICKAVTALASQVSGSYSVVTLLADHGLVAFRDPNGIRPLVLGKREAKRTNEMVSTAYMIASESVALSINGYEPIRNLEPGEILFITTKGELHSHIIQGSQKRHCMFEWVYFSSPESVIDGVPVYGSRIELGKSLGKLIRKEFSDRGLIADIVVPVPETARIAAIAVAEELEIPYREVLIKNQYIKRTFIMESQERRETAVNLKLSPVKSEIIGKRVLLVDDSIVRGTTSKKLIALVRKAGASAVYFVSTCPPIKSPCFYGIDFPSGAELLAYERDQKEIEKILGADAVIYQDINGLVNSIDKKFVPCMACLDGSYPTDVSEGVEFAKVRNSDRSRT